MTPAQSTVAAALADAYQQEWAFVLAATVALAADLDVAEECAQGAFARALSAWERTGVPQRPGAWLTTAARNLVIDHFRRSSALSRRLPLLVGLDEEADPGEIPEIRDDRLRLIFTCCHPALAETSQVALTLRLVGGLSTAEVARAFLVSETTMAARITRAKHKISQARIPYRTPGQDEWPERMRSVLSVVHLVFTTGHAAPSGDSLVRVDLVERAVALARMLHEVQPKDPEVTGLLALIMLTDARRSGRTDEGELVLLADQDRSCWDHVAIAVGSQLVDEALDASPTGVYVVLAAIAREHSCAPSWAATNWSEILRLYDVMLASWPSPVVALNRAVAVGFSRGPVAGARELDALAGEPRLAAYPYYPAARADFARQLGDVALAAMYYQEALVLSTNDVERAFLERRLVELGPL